MASTINASTSGAGGVITTADNTGVLQLQTAGTTAITVDASQNVGIGTGTPANSVQISKTTYPTLQLTETTANTSFIMQYHSALAAGYLTITGAQPMAFQTSNTERMRITANGGVAFGGASNYGTSGQVLISQGNASPVWGTAGGMTLLGTMTTTSGSSVSLTGLTLTNYKQLYCVINGVSSSASGNLQLTDPTTTQLTIVGFSSTTTNRVSGGLWIDLPSGALWWCLGSAVPSTTPSVAPGSTNGIGGGNTTYSTSSTSIAFNNTSGTFDAGSILVYGVA